MTEQDPVEATAEKLTHDLMVQGVSLPWYIAKVVAQYIAEADPSPKHVNVILDYELHRSAARSTAPACDHCGKPLGDEARYNQLFCDEPACRRERSRRKQRAYYRRQHPPT